VLALAKQYHWSLVATFTEGRTPALWREYRALLAQCPANYLRRTWRDGPTQEFRWLRGLDYEGSEGRRHRAHALEGTETPAQGPARYSAWLTLLPVGVKTVAAIAQQGGRYRGKIEKEGFNRQKNSGLNLEQVYSTGPEKWQAYYALLQIAFILVQLLERGSLQRRLAAELGRPVGKLFGSLKHVARRLLEGVRYFVWDEAWFDGPQAAGLHIGWDSSERSGGQRFSGSGEHLPRVCAKALRGRRRSGCAASPAGPYGQLRLRTAATAIPHR
jgi:hypothetical protein